MCMHTVHWHDNALWPCKRAQPGSVSVKVLQAFRPAITPGMNHGNVKYKVCNGRSVSALRDIDHHRLEHKNTSVITINLVFIFVDDRNN